MDDQAGLVLDVMEARAYARTKEAVDRAQKEKDMPTGPMAEWVFVVERELMLRKRRKARGDSG